MDWGEWDLNKNDRYKLVVRDERLLEVSLSLGLKVGLGVCIVTGLEFKLVNG